MRIMQTSGRLRRTETSHTNQFKMFFIADPEVKVQAVGDVDRMVDAVKNQSPGILTEIFSTHPHPAKRLRHLDRFLS